ncbi:MAG TPA: O-antigen ligase family protein [Opitutaceae bacterium]|nr:O-antigen ligase family protein [Opitutaceae bacterium]
MNPRLRTTLITLFCAVLAVWLGWKVAEGSYFWPGLAAAAAIGAVSVRLLRLPLDVIVCGWLLIGYIAGNRGFAQLMPAPGIPLLPAEAALLLACSWRFVAAAVERRLPFRRDALDWAVLAFLAVGGVRLVFDFPRFGFLALRDSAMVYYALFFFLAREMARDRAAARYLLGCALVGCALLPPLFALYTLFPSVFLERLTVHGVPLVFYKGDLMNTYFAAGSLLLFLLARGLAQPLLRLVASGMFLYVLAGDNRASLLGLLAATALLAVARRWRYPLWQVAGAGLAAIVVGGLAHFADNAWAERKLAGFADRARSVTDVFGLRAYASEESGYKGDNNRFRYIWWRNVLVDTWTQNPVLGLGFGADLAGSFLQEYYPDSAEEFTARSPHNYHLSVFGRLGLVGVAAWLWVCLALAQCGWRSLRQDHDAAGWALWSVVTVIVVSASFGVVLEGPMGAVPFWMIAGLAASRLTKQPEPAPAASGEAAPATPEPAAGAGHR